MLNEIIRDRLQLDTAAFAGACLWSLALYLSLSSLRNWIIEQLDRWFNFAEGFLYTSAKEFERTRPARESQNAFYASLLSIVPFLALGELCNWGLQISLGRSWAVSTGILATMICGIYQLGRQDSKS